MNFPCDTCKYRERDCDPFGCWHELSSTGWLGRFWVWVTGGCEQWEEVKAWKQS